MYPILLCCIFKALYNYALFIIACTSVQLLGNSPCRFDVKGNRDCSTLPLSVPEWYWHVASKDRRRLKRLQTTQVWGQTIFYARERNTAHYSSIQLTTTAHCYYSSLILLQLSALNLTITLFLNLFLSITI